MNQDLPADPSLVHVRPKDVPRLTGGAVSERQARRWIAEKKIAVFKPSGRTGPALINLEDLKGFIAVNTVEPM